MFWKAKQPDPPPEPCSIVGFWCMPIGAGAFMKLGIRECYQVGSKSRPVMNGNQIGAAWAIIGNAKMLADYFPWVPEIIVQIGNVYGNDIFKDEADPGRQAQVLRLITQEAFSHQWAYVLPDDRTADTVLIGASEIAFRDALYDELTATALQNPADIRLKMTAPPKFAVLVDYHGQREEPQTIEQLLRNPVTA